MSLARVKTVTKSLKPYECGKCKTELPKGSAYRHYKIGFRSRFRHIRCMEPVCTPKASELESSKLSGVYAAQEDALASVEDASTLEEITGALESCAEAIREVATEYSDAAEAMGDAGYEMQEKADALESAADELESADIAEPDEEADCGDCGGTGRVINPEYDPELEDQEAGDEEVDCDACDGSGRVEVPEDERDLTEARDDASSALNDMEMP